MNYDDITIIKANIGGLLDSYMDGYGIKLERAYKRYSFLDKRIRMMDLSLINKYESQQYNNKLKGIKGTIIIFDSCIKSNFLIWIKNNNPDARIIYWYWNPAYCYFNLTRSHIPDGIEIWTYSIKDAKKFGFGYNTQFSFMEIAEAFEIERNEYDICFIGSDKGRIKNVKRIIKYVESIGMTAFVYVVPSRSYKKIIYHNSQISYQMCLNYTSRSRCILDFYDDSRAGFSLRVMEALFMNKKLITNNENIYGADFYNTSNIYVIKDGSFDGLEEFMNEPSVEVDENIKRKYDFDNWIKRFNI